MKYRLQILKAALCLAAAFPLSAALPPATPGITGVQHTSGGQFRVTVAGTAGSYHLLQRSDSLAGPWSARALRPGSGGNVSLADAASMTGRAFYRVLTVPVSAPLDSDGDGLDDLAEWRAGGSGNPFNPALPTASTDAAVLLHIHMVATRTQAQLGRQADKGIASETLAPHN